MKCISISLLLAALFLISQPAMAQYDPDDLESKAIVQGRRSVYDSVYCHILLNTIPTIAQSFRAYELEVNYGKEKLMWIGVLGVHFPKSDSLNENPGGSLEQRGYYGKFGFAVNKYFTRIKNNKERTRYLMSGAGLTLLYLKEREWGVIPGQYYGDLSYDFEKKQVDGAIWGRVEYGWFLGDDWILATNIDLSVRLFRAVDGKEHFNTRFYPGIGFNTNGSSATSASWLYPRIGLKVGYRLR